MVFREVWFGSDQHRGRNKAPPCAAAPHPMKPNSRRPPKMLRAPALWYIEPARWRVGASGIDHHKAWDTAAASADRR